MWPTARLQTQIWPTSKCIINVSPSLPPPPASPVAAFYLAPVLIRL